MNDRQKENLKFVRWVVTHPLLALAGLAFLAAMEGAFGSPTGAQRLLYITAHVLVLVALSVIVGLGVWLTTSGYGVQLWIGMGLLVVIIWLPVHLQWKE